MSPKVADPAVRVALIEHAAQITAEEGRDALTLRRLASAVGTSTMAVYTHFGSMEELRRAVRREGFARLARHLDTVGRTDDPVADLSVQGWAYYVNGTTNPHLYRAMFMDGYVDRGDRGDRADRADRADRGDRGGEDDEGGTGVGGGTFERLVAGVRRCIEAGRFDPADPDALATQLWVTAHGVVTLELAGMMTTPKALGCLRDMVTSLCVAFGDTRDAFEASFARAQPRFTSVGST